MRPQLVERIEELVAAGMPALYLQSSELATDVICQIYDLCEEHNWLLYVWDLENGTARIEYHANLQSCAPTQQQIAPTMQAALDFFAESNKNALDAEGKKPFSILVLKNGHRMLDSHITSIQNKATIGKKSQQCFIVLSSVLKIPPELSEQRLFQLVEHELPDREELLEIARGVAEASEVPDGPATEALLDAAAGLTRSGAENAFALSLVRHEELRADTIWEMKRDALKLESNRAMTMHEGHEDFEMVGGLSYLKQFCVEVLGQRPTNPKFRARGVLLTGVSGGGKSLFAKALGNELQRPTLCFNIGATMGSLVGQSGAQFRRALKVADAMQPCILFIDEVEKAFAGAGHDAKTSGGVRTEMMGEFLTWLQEHTSDVFVICTSNDIRKISDDHPEFIRSGRFDQMFFIDFPGREAKDQIWRIHLQGYELSTNEDDPLAGITLPDDTDWTGAEIENCCRQAKLRGRTVAEVGRDLPRIKDQAADRIAAMREWAAGKCFSAEQGGLYSQHKASQPTMTGMRRNVRTKKRGT